MAWLFSIATSEYLKRYSGEDTAIVSRSCREIEYNFVLYMTTHQIQYNFIYFPIFLLQNYSLNMPNTHIISTNLSKGCTEIGVYKKYKKVTFVSSVSSGVKLERKRRRFLFQMCTKSHTEICE